MSNVQQISFSAALGESSKSRKMGQKSRKSVVISETATVVHIIENLYQLSAEERAQVWWSRKESDEIRRGYKNLISKMSNKELLRETDDCCTRGLEGKSRAGFKQRRDAQLNGLLAVLNEQDRQQAEGVNEPETLAIIYRQFSYHCQQAAANMGRRDQQAIAEYTYNMDASYRPRQARSTRLPAPNLQERRSPRSVPRRRPTVVVAGSSRRRAAAA